MFHFRQRTVEKDQDVYYLIKVGKKAKEGEALIKSTCKEKLPLIA